MRTLFDLPTREPSPPPDPGAALARARLELDYWLQQEQIRHTVLAGIEVVDPKVRWNVEFHRRHVAALERAIAEARRLAEVCAS